VKADLIIKDKTTTKMADFLIILSNFSTLLLHILRTYDQACNQGEILPPGKCIGHI